MSFPPVYRRFINRFLWIPSRQSIINYTYPWLNSGQCCLSLFTNKSGEGRFLSVCKRRNIMQPIYLFPTRPRFVSSTLNMVIMLYHGEGCSTSSPGHMWSRVEPCRVIHHERQEKFITGKTHLIITMNEQVNGSSGQHWSNLTKWSMAEIRKRMRFANHHKY